MQRANYTPNELKAALSGGLIPAMPVMFDREGRFHERAHEAYVTFMSSQPIAGAAVWAHTGRGLLLDEDTAPVVMQQWRQGLPSKPLIAGAGARGKHSNPTIATVSMAPGFRSNQQRQDLQVTP